MSKNFIPQDINERIKDRADIVEVIGKSLHLKKKGVNYIGNCPFHNEKTDSFVVSPSKGIYKCFGCGAGGDVIEFVKESEKISYPEAIKYLANLYSIELPSVEQTDEEKARQKRREAAYIALAEVNQLFQKNLTENENAHAYIFGQRSITPETIQTFQIGFAESDNQVKEQLPKKGFSFENLMAAGLTAISDKGFQYDVFRARITFPYLDVHGRIIGHSGRILDDTEKAAKYLNTSDTVVFNKGKALFGLYQAKEAIKKMDSVYLVEGQFDVVTLHQNGIKNVIAGSGTALTDDQARLIKRFTSKAVLLYDPDAAGIKACLRNMKTLLANGLEVKAILLPNGQDPDEFVRAAAGTKKDISILLENRKKKFIEYFIEATNLTEAEEIRKAELFDEICEIISVIPDKYLRDRYAITLSNKFETSINLILQKVKPKVGLKIDKWKDGFYGLDEAVELMKILEENTSNFTFKEEVFIDEFSETPTILAIGSPSLLDIQTLRSKVSKINIIENTIFHPKYDDDKKLLTEPKELQLLKNMHKHGIDISIEGDEVKGFCDFYVDKYSEILELVKKDSNKIAEITGKCAEVIVDLDATVRVVMNDVYAKKLGQKSTAFAKLLKPFLAKKKDKAVVDNQRLNEMQNMLSFDTEMIPEYVQNDANLYSAYIRWGFYPLADNNGRFCAYMFKNTSSNSHFPISDFYIKPLLHVYDPENDDANNKRVIQLCHMDGSKDRYVEWKSSIFANKNDVHKKCVNEGSFNFYGTVDQYNKVWMFMSYGFTMCRAIRVFGQHQKGFFAFGNAIFHKVDDKYQVDMMDELGIVTHNNENFYSPAFSKIRINEENSQGSFNQARNLVYKDIPEDKQISFAKWADLMNRVYSINDNGKWAILYAVTCAFRDFIFEMRRYFTAIFFIGPTSSGKSQIAESIRNLYMTDTTPAFNLNTGSDAGFFMILESIMNVPVVMEEYNEAITKTKYQGLKAATLDGEGKIKVKDVSSKQLDSSAINASIILLGQEAAQQDDGALSNRCIMCDVPYRTGDFSEEETEIFELLKSYEKQGLSNILLKILELRPVYEKYFLGILAEETKKLKDSVRISVNNTEGLTRIINACALMTATCRLLEDHAPELKLPFTYEEFLPIAENKILTQIERISSTNKLTTYFQSINTLLTQERIKIGREIKLENVSSVTRMLSGKKKEEVELPYDTKVLFIDFEAVYVLYSSSIGKDECLSRQSLRAYFESHQAFIGLTNSTWFRWEVPEHTVGAVEATAAAGDEEVTISNVARMRMVKKQKNTSAYMFNYNILKTLISVDYERLDPDKEPPLFKVPEQNLPF